MAGGLAGVRGRSPRELLEAEGVGGALPRSGSWSPTARASWPSWPWPSGARGINIHDMSLSPSADNTRGEVAFWVPEAEARASRGGRRGA